MIQSKNPKNQTPLITSADNKETIKLLMTWAKKHNKIPTFKIAVDIVMEMQRKNLITQQAQLGCQVEMPTPQNIALTFFRCNDTENKFITSMQTWDNFIKRMGTTYRMVQKSLEAGKH